MKKIATSMLFLWLSLLLYSCRSEAVDGQHGSPVLLKISVKSSLPEVPTRAQGETPSLNTDFTDGEDFIDRFAAFVFDSSSGQLLARHFQSGSAEFVLEVETGLRDFYFLANYPEEMLADLSSGSLTAGRLTELLRREHPFGLWTPSAANRFPMARIYPAQPVRKEGDGTRPVPFRPLQLNYEAPLSPVSSYGEEYPDNFRPEGIHLVRACAKVSLKCSGEGMDDIQSIRYVNAAGQYTFMEHPAADFGAAAPLELRLNSRNEVCFYVPERLFSPFVPHWEYEKGAKDEALNGANYLEFTMKGGTVYKLPMIHNSSYEGDYMTFAKTAPEANYNVVRNHEYRFGIHVPIERAIMIDHFVEPWTVAESVLDFGDSSGSLLPAGGTQYADSSKKMVLTHGTAPVYFSLKIKAPTGAVWSASVTNGLDFKIEPAEELTAPGSREEMAATSGIVLPDVTYRLKVTPVKPFTTTPHFTHIYVTVEGKEIQVAEGYHNENPGAQKRLMIKQIE